MGVIDAIEVKAIDSGEVSSVTVAEIDDKPPSLDPDGLQFM